MSIVDTKRTFRYFQHRLDFIENLWYNEFEVQEVMVAAWKGCYHCVTGITGDTLTE